jgi:hypothetical protein
MAKPIEEIKKDSQQRTPGILPFAVVVGLLVFFVTSAEAGGLSGVQGFFVGLFAVIFLFVMVGVVGVFLESRRHTLEASQTSLHGLGKMSVTQQESEEGLTIQIYVPKQAALKREAISDR